MTPLRVPTELTTSPPARATASKTDQVVDVASTVLDDALKVLELLSDVTENVPYLNTITGCIQKLIDIRTVMKNNKERANELLSKVGEITHVVAQGLQDLEVGKRTIALTRLEVDLRRYENFLSELCEILKEWTSKSFAKRLWSHGDFPGIAEGIDRRLDTFRDAFSVARLIDLSTGQDVLDKKVQTLVNGDMRRNLKEWLQPANVAISERDAANRRHPETGKWLLERAEFRGWIYAPHSLLWVHGISGSGKTVLSSTIIGALRARREPLAFFYFDTNNPGQHTVTQLLCSLVSQLSVQADFPDKTLNQLWETHAKGQHLPSDPVLISAALIPILTEFTRPVYIVLDALDECSEINKLLKFLTQILEAVPSTVHLLLTSRPEVVHGTNLVQAAVSLSLDGCMDQDIESYIWEKLSGLGTEWAEDRKEQIRVGLLERSGGMFRLAALQLDRILNGDGRKSQVTKALSEMPTSLETLYDRILQDIADPDMVSAVGRAITWLMFSKHPIKLEEIIDTLAIDFDQQPLRFNPDERMQSKALLTACAGFVTVLENTTIKLAHASVNDYFLSAKKPRDLYGDSAFLKPTGHLLIARTCVAYLCSLDRVLDDEADLQRFPLALYAAKNWAFHAKLCDEIRFGGADEIMRVPGGVQNPVIPMTNSDVCRPRELVEAILELLRRDSAQHISLCRLHDFDGQPWENRGFSRSAPTLPPLYMSAMAGIEQVVRLLLTQGEDVNEKGGYYGPALEAASYGGNIEIVHLLIDEGADVNSQDGYYGTALQAASHGGSLEVVRLLIDKGARVHSQGGDYGTALQAASYGGTIEVVHLLIDRGANVNTNSGRYGNALQAASYRGNIEIVCLLIDTGADVSSQGGYYGTALQAASYGGNIEVARLLIERGVDVNAQGGIYGNALQAAFHWGQTDVGRLLIEHGADVNAQGGEYGNVLQAAARWGYTDVARLLIEHGVDVNAQGKYGTALQAASDRGRTDVARLLIEHGHVDVNAQGGKYRTALQAAVRWGYTDCARMLLEHGADMNVPDEKYGSALHAASYGRHTDVVHVLLEYGADVNVQGGIYGNALQAACTDKEPDVARLLIAHGADVNAQGGECDTALYAACVFGRLEVVHMLLEHGADVNAQGRQYGSALQVACASGNIEVAHLLLEHGADVNAVSGEYGTALQVACVYGRIEIMHLLLDHGADVNMQGGKYGSALQAASAAGKIAVVHLLLEHGVDVNLQGGKYGSALQAALEGGHTDVLQLLSENAAVGIPA
ncbi:ankyrin repeat-containing domain protein [Mycena latifolia]|nr:ankyrin repeat-containing domain protein [Mycena latifolia]